MSKEEKTVIPEGRLKLDLKKGNQLNLGRLGFKSYQEPIVNASIELIGDSSREISLAFFLDASYHPLCYLIVGLGTQDGVDFSVGEVAKTALLSNASHVIMVHNHPTAEGREFSLDDIMITKMAYELLKIIGVKLLDSIVLPYGEKYLSLRNDTEMFYELIQNYRLDPRRELEQFYLKKLEENHKKDNKKI